MFEKVEFSFNLKQALKQCKNIKMAQNSSVNERSMKLYKSTFDFLNLIPSKSGSQG